MAVGFHHVVLGQGDLKEGVGIPVFVGGGVQEVNVALLDIVVEEIGGAHGDDGGGIAEDGKTVDVLVGDFQAGWAIEPNEVGDSEVLGEGGFGISE